MVEDRRLVVLEEALSALAATGATALVTAMVTDGWESVRARFARLLGRGDGSRSEIAVARMEESRALLASSSGAVFEHAKAEQEAAWRTVLEELLERDSGSAAELQAVVEDLRAQVDGGAWRVEQHAAAYGQAQQAIQGYGVQNVTFGRRSGSGDDH